MKPMPLANPTFFFSMTGFLSDHFVFYYKKYGPDQNGTGPTLGIPSAVVLSREYRFGVSCWRRNAQNAEYNNAYNDSHIHSRGAASHAQFVFQPQKRQHRDHVRGRLRML